MVPSESSFKNDQADLRVDPKDWLDYHEVGGSLNPGAGNSLKLSSLLWTAEYLEFLPAHLTFVAASDGAGVLSWTREVDSQIADLRFQIANLRSQISDFRSQISDLRSSQISGCGFQVAGFRLQISETLKRQLQIF
jgi:hypothetical protein